MQALPAAIAVGVTVVVALASLLSSGDAPATLPLSPGKRPAPAEVTRWINENAVPLASVVAGTPLDDLAPLEKTIGSARVVALGEATHGTREFFQLKHRMLEFLVRKMGFTVFGIEASLPDALAVDAYVTAGTGDPAAALSGLGFWTWDTEEVLEMIRWMRRYNEDEKNARKLRFYGFDMQSPTATADRLAQYLKRVDDPAEVTRLLEPLAPLLARQRQREEPTPPDEETAKVKRGVEALGTRLTQKKASYLAATGATDYALALQLVELLRQAQAVRWGDGYFARDRAMADNVRWILDQQPSGTRMVLWAHNGHITTDDVAKGGYMGVHLEKVLGPDYLTFGFAFARGSFQAKRRGQELQIMTVGAPKEESLDAALAKADPAIFALDLRRVPEEGPVAEWFDAVRPARSVGAVFEPAKESSYYVSRRPQGAYDALLFVENTTTAIAAGRWAGTVEAATPDEPEEQARQLPPLPETPSNLDFEAAVLEEADWQGWFSPTKGKGYGVTLDTTAAMEGKQCARLERDGEGRAPFGNLMQRINAVPYRGKTVKLQASVRSEGQAQLWLRVDCENREVGFFDNMDDRPIKDPQWKPYTIVGDVAPDAVSLNFGVMLLGEGRLWIDGVTLEVVSP